MRRVCRAYFPRHPVDKFATVRFFDPARGSRTRTIARIATVGCKRRCIARKSWRGLALPGGRRGSGKSLREEICRGAALDFWCAARVVPVLPPFEASPQTAAKRAQPGRRTRNPRPRHDVFLRATASRNPGDPIGRASLRHDFRAMQRLLHPTV